MDRVLILLLLAFLIILLWLGIRVWRQVATSRLRHETPFADLIPTGQPAVVSFSTPHCAECRTRQAPALKQLANQLSGQATIQSLSALDHPELVSKLGILTVPATVIVTPQGRVAQVNLGFTTSETLAAQLQQHSR